MRFNPNPTFKLSSLALCVLLTACGGSDNKTAVVTEPDPEPTPSAPTQGTIFGPYSTGSVSESTFVYYDLDTNAVVELTTEQASDNVQWDIAFKRTGVYLNQHSDNAITAYAMGHNSDFFDGEGNVIADSFINATAELALDDYLSVKTSDVPTDDSLFVGDVTSSIIDGFYHYDSTTHVVTAADDHYFVVNSDSAFTKFRAAEITTAGYGIGQITFKTAYQGADDAEFGPEQDLTIDAAMICSGDVTDVYIDFDINQEVTADDAWDVKLPCAEDKTGAGFEINIADDSTALQDFDNQYTAVDPASAAYYGFKENSYSVKAFDGTSWYQYNLQGGHKLWSQYDVYLVKTPTATHKLQITSYYDAEGTSGNLSFRTDELNELAGEAP